MQHVYVTLMPIFFLSGLRLSPVSNSEALLCVSALHELPFLMISPAAWLVKSPTVTLCAGGSGALAS